eukprot:SAG11_NODE_25860_length_353_cov_0.610236_2_plen_41_part_01
MFFCTVVYGNKPTLFDVSYFRSFFFIITALICANRYYSHFP